MQTTIKTALQKLVVSALFVAIGIVLPFFTGQIQQIGNLLLPMHLPVFLCGLICGWQHGAVVGFVLPLLRSILFHMPALFPNAVAMAMELAVYGLVTGLIYHMCKRQSLLSVYLSIMPAMLCGRVVWGIVQVILLGLQHNVFTWKMFFAGAFLNAIPGIILQLLLIPAIMTALHLTGVLKYRKEEAPVS